MIKVGDTVKKKISCRSTSGFTGARMPEEGVVRTGKVVYVHPKGRYYVAEFAFQDGTIRECYRDGEID